MARVGKKSEIYADMVEFLKEIIDECSDDLSINFKNVQSVGLKNLILAQRSDSKTTESNKVYPFWFWKFTICSNFVIIPLHYG